MNDKCKKCRWYIKASDGIFIHEVCYLTQGKQDDTCRKEQLEKMIASCNKAIAEMADAVTAAANQMAKALTKAFAGINIARKESIDE